MRKEEQPTLIEYILGYACLIGFWYIFGMTMYQYWFIG